VKIFGHFVLLHGVGNYCGSKLSSCETCKGLRPYYFLTTGEFKLINLPLIISASLIKTYYC